MIIMQDDVVIGLEIHVSLDTKSKLFCSCPASGSDVPNSRTCDVCVGFPGSKPVVNKKAVEHALKLCLALNCNISPELIFSRKVYFYPDMGKNYQITQYELPLGTNGKLKISNKEINITRVHIEEDPGSLVHQVSTVLVDYNRSGTPLCEIVTEPEMSSPEEARDFLKRLLTILNYLHIFDSKNGIIKADANISIKGYERVEIKNINGFKDIQKALKYEIERHRKIIKEGNGLKHRETRGWDSAKGITVFQRAKEQEADYGYIIDPDLVPIEISELLIKETRNSLPELPEKKSLRYTNDLKLKKDDAEVIANDYELAYLFESAVSHKISPLFSAEWIRREVTRVLNYSKKELDETFMPKNLVSVMGLIADNKITRQTGQRLMERLVDKDLDVTKYVKKENLEIVSSAKELEEICKKVVGDNDKAVQEYLDGNEKSFNFLVGNVMKLTRGKGNPKVINEILRKLVKN